MIVLFPIVLGEIAFRYWYVSLVSCTRNRSTCEWEPTAKDLTVNYDLWLVNGNPRGKKDPFVYQYSADQQVRKSFPVLSRICC